MDLKRRLCAAVVVGATCVPTVVSAQDSGRWYDDPNAILTLTVENDLFANTDRHYTNGIRLSWLSSEGRIPEWVKDAADWFPLFPEGGKRRVGFSLGQSMFTPRDISIDPPEPDDRPYAGFLYGGVGLVSDTGSRLDTLELQLGVVGPASLAEEAQKLVHSITGSQQPKAWDTQLENEPAIVLTYERKWRGLWEFSPFGFGADITPHVGGSIGNVYTHATAGFMLRIGEDLPSDYGPPRIRPSLPGSDFFVPTQSFGWYLFAGVEGRAVARNIFLDGNTFEDSRSVDKKHFIGDAQAGIAVTFSGIRLAYTHIFRTKEFDGQDKPDQFGAVSVSFRF